MLCEVVVSDPSISLGLIAGCKPVLNVAIGAALVFTLDLQIVILNVNMQKKIEEETELWNFKHQSQIEQNL